MNVEWIETGDNDYPAIKEIYDYYVQHSTATFATSLPTIESLKVAIPSGHPKYRSYLIKSEGTVCGYCYISQHNRREAYDRTAEVTIYLRPEFTGRGIGQQTLEMIKTVARDNGISVLLGVISAENTGSVRLFEKCGFEKCAHFKKVGEKFNRLLDVVVYQVILDE